MVNFDYNELMKRFDIKVPFVLADENDMVNIGAITEDDRLTLHRDVSLKLLRQVLIAWDERNYMKKHEEERKEIEFNELLDDPIRINKEGA